MNDKTITSAHGASSQEVDAALGSGVSDQGRGSGCSSSAPAMIGPVIRTICYIAAELVRLVNCVESMKPVLQSLYHRILLYPPPQHRLEAIKIMKEVGFKFTFINFAVILIRQISVLYYQCKNERVNMLIICT